MECFTPIPAIFNLNGETLSIERVSPFKLKIAGIGVKHSITCLLMIKHLCMHHTHLEIGFHHFSIYFKIGVKHFLKWLLMIKQFCMETTDKKWLKVLQIIESQI
jgi:hypothetical protein